VCVSFFIRVHHFCRKSNIYFYMAHFQKKVSFFFCRNREEVSVHYVDSIGFKDLQGFLDKQPERHSVLMNLKEKCDAPECNPTGCRKARNAHEL
jgi:hypothetical protein